MKPLPLSLLLSLTALSGFVGLGTCLSADASLSTAQIVEVVRKSKALGERARISAAASGQDVALSSFRNKTDTPKDLKIEAIMSAKALVEADPTIRRVTFRFYEVWQPKRYAEVTVTAPEIKAFGTGVVTADELLASMRFVEGNEALPSGTTVAKPDQPGAADAPGPGGTAVTAAAPAVVAGPLKLERTAVFNRITALSAAGVNTASLVASWGTVEKLAANNQIGALGQALDALTANVAHQEVNVEIGKRRPIASANVANTPGSLPLVGKADSLTVKDPSGAAAASPSDERYGEFNPSSQGLMPAERLKVAERIRLLQTKGYPVSRYSTLFHELEASAAARNQTTTDQLLRRIKYYVDAEPPRFPQ